MFLNQVHCKNQKNLDDIMFISITNTISPNHNRLEMMVITVMYLFTNYIREKASIYAPLSNEFNF